MQLFEANGIPWTAKLTHRVVSPVSLPPAYKHVQCLFLVRNKRNAKRNEFQRKPVHQRWSWQLLLSQQQRVRILPRRKPCPLHQFYRKWRMAPQWQYRELLVWRTIPINQHQIPLLSGKSKGFSSPGPFQGHSITFIAQKSQLPSKIAVFFRNKTLFYLKK